MNGYFSRLVQQTDISLGAERIAEPPTARNETAPIPAEEAGMMTPHETQETTAIVHSAERVADASTSDRPSVVHVEETRQSQPEVVSLRAQPEAESQSIAPKADAQPVEPAVEAKHESPQIIRRSTVESVREQSVPPSRIHHQPEVSIPESTPRADRGQTIFNRNIQSVPAVDLRTEESQEGAVGFVGREPHAVDETAFQSNPVPAPLMPNQPSRLHAWHTTLNAVREWVAEVPIADTDTFQYHAAGEADPMGEEHGEVLGQKAGPSHARPIRSPQNAPADVQDLHLTIGTIHLTVEAPQQAIQTHPPQKSRQERQPQRDSQSTRLRRYYLR